MAKHDTDLDRLLRSATRTGEEPGAEAPFGFATRVVAQWRAARGGASELRDLSSFLRRVVLLALTIIAVSTGGAFWQFSKNQDLNEPFSNEYAIADSAIQDAILP